MCIISREDWVDIAGREKHVVETMPGFTQCQSAFRLLICRLWIWFVAVAVPSCAWCDRALAENAGATDLAQASQLIATYCHDCHEGEQAERGLALAAVTSERESWRHRAQWEKVLRRLREHVMPPVDAEQPTQAERDAIVAAIENHVLRPQPSEPRDPGRAPLRRLTRQEYYNTLGDLLGIEPEPSSPVPADAGGGEGFSNNADTLVLSPVSMEKYLDTVNEALAQAMQDPGARARLLQVPAGAALSNRETVRAALTELARRAWRRPATSGEIDRLMERFVPAKEGKQDSGSAALEQETVQAMKAIMLSPNFLYRVEAVHDMPQPFRVSDFELATRLSYFLWSTMPDDELFELAAQQRLRDPKILSSQVRRMLANPKSRALADNFGSEWLGYEDLGTEYHPWNTPQYTGSLAMAMRQETSHFVAHLFRENRSLLELLDSNYTFVNEELARLYGIEGITGDEIRKIALTDKQRGGVVTMASILTITSYPVRTSPVLRGRWVLNQILGSPPPPPPPSAPDLAKGKVLEALSMRERLARHRKDPSCAACHDRMDPIGLSLENYDLIGRWRTQDKQGQAIDASGSLPTGESFVGPAELKALLLSRRERFAWHVSEKMLGYALGRGVEASDYPALYEIVETVKGNDYRVHAMIEAIASSMPIQYRRGASAPASE